MSLSTVAYQGAPGAFSHEACLRLMPFDEPVSFRDFRGAVDAVSSGECGCALLPVENNTAGQVPEVSEMIAAAGLHVDADTWLPIRHQLIVAEGATLQSITKVRSHPMALAQCAKAIARYNLKAEEAYDTAGAAEDLAQSRDLATAVIASRTAAELYELEILRENIEDDPENATRFVVVSREARPHGR